MNPAGGAARRPGSLLGSAAWEHRAPRGAWSGDTLVAGQNVHLCPHDDDEELPPGRRTAVRSAGWSGPAVPQWPLCAGAFPHSTLAPPSRPALPRLRSPTCLQMSAAHTRQPSFPQWGGHAGLQVPPVQAVPFRSRSPRRLRLSSGGRWQRSGSLLEHLSP